MLRDENPSLGMQGFEEKKLDFWKMVGSSQERRRRRSLVDNVERGSEGRVRGKRGDEDLFDKIKQVVKFALWSLL
jgi:hypothetical protein